MKIGCVILAAGSGMRFGGDKLHAEFSGVSLIRRAMQAVPEGCPAAVVTGDSQIAALAREQQMTVVWNHRPELGISRSVRLGTMAMTQYNAICFLVADQPLLKRESVQKLLDEWRLHPDRIIRAAHDGKPGNPCVFPREFFPALCNLQGDRGGSAVARSFPEKVIMVELPKRELLDCDTPEVLRQLCSEEGSS
ncbi:MAG: nucleotidyltransferase family protein [Ruminococcaceae bacterium]|nr:nucleotidyltransferase family protein [Oscillospiraceae bacterium]